MFAGGYSRYAPAGEWQYYAGDGTQFCVSGVSSTTTLAVDTWQHVAVTYDGTDALIIVDGVDASTGGTVVTGRSLVASHTAGIGNNKNASALDFNGRVADTLVFDRALSLSEIQLLFQGPT